MSSGKFASVLIAIGAETSGLRKGLLDAEKTLGRWQRGLTTMSRRATLVGAELTRGITLPIALLGAGAVKAFRDIELLRRGLILVAGDAKKGAEEFKALSEIARLPGIGFEEAIHGSMQLQSIGVAADSARAILIGLGKANTYGAGTAVEFGRAMKQVTDILVRGKVTMEDWRRAAQAIPILGRLAKEVYGTGDIEKIRDSGVGAGDFIAEVMKKALELVDANEILGTSTDTLANSWDNFIMDLKIGASTIGEAIVKSGNLQQILGNVSGAVKGLGEAFGKMNPEQQKSFLQTVAMIAVFPLMIRLLGQVGLVISTVVLPAIKGLIWSVRQLLKPIGLILVLFASLDQVLKFFRNNAETAGKALNAATGSAFTGVATLADGMNKLGVMTDENGKAVSFLSKAWGGLKDVMKLAGGEVYDMVFGEGSLSGLNDAIGLVKEGMANMNTSIPEFDIDELKSALDKLKGMFDDPEKAKKDVRDLNKEYEELLSTMEALGTSVSDAAGQRMSFAAGAVEDLVKRGFKRGNPELEKWVALYKQLEQFDLVSKVLAEAKAIDRLAEALKKMPEPKASMPEGRGQLAEGMTSAGNVFRDLFQGLGENDIFGVTLDNWMNDVVKFVDGAAMILGSLGETLAAAFDAKEARLDAYYDKELDRIENSAMSEEEKAKRIKSLEEKKEKEIAKLRRKQAVLAKAAAMAEAGMNIAVAITKSLANPVLAAIIAGLGAVQLGIIAATPLPSAKHGGAAFGETLVNVGDYPRASVDPEVIAPASMIGDILAETMGGARDRIVGVVSGDDLLLIASKAQYNQKRRRGLTLQF